MPKDRLKMDAARFALSKVSSGMRLGIGTGSTVDCFIKILGERVASGLDIIGVTTSNQSCDSCRQAGIPLALFNDCPELDLIVDGADEIAPDLSLIKGKGGAFLYEKMVAHAAKYMMIIADESKLVARLGSAPVPLEVSSFGYIATMQSLKKMSQKLNLSASFVLREKNGKPFITDGGHFIVDSFWSSIPDVFALSNALHAIPGVLENGLFINFADLAIIAGQDGMQEIYSKDRNNR